MALPRNLAFDEIIDEPWTDAVVDTLTSHDRRGIAAYAEIQNQPTFTGLTDIPGLSATFTAVAGHRYKVTAYCGRVANPTSPNMSVFVYIKEGATVLQTALISQGVASAAGGGNPVNLLCIVSPSAGAHTYKVAAARVSGTDVHTWEASPTEPSFIVVEDMG